MFTTSVVASTKTLQSTDPFFEFLRQRLRFSIDPFQHEEASTDPYLGEYLVGLEQFQIAREHHPALIYAPAGGGKTAMRVHTLRSCWMGLAGPHPLPISCIPTVEQIEDGLSEEEFWLFLARSTATSLLLGLSYRPARFLYLDQADQQRLVGLWRQLLPGPFARYWRILSDTLEPYSLTRRLDPAFQLPDQPDRSQLWDFCYQLQATPTAVLTDSAQKNWRELRHLLRSGLGFGPLFLLFDGLDGFPATIHNPAMAVGWLLPFLQKARFLADQQVYIKAFLPREIRPLFEDDYLSEPLPSTELVWTPELLAEMIRRRVAYASNNSMGSLDAVSASDLRNVEVEVVERSPSHLPRSIVRLTRSVLDNWRRRTTDKPGPLEEQDLEMAGLRRRAELSDAAATG